MEAKASRNLLMFKHNLELVISDNDFEILAMKVFGFQWIFYFLFKRVSLFLFFSRDLLKFYLHQQHYFIHFVSLLALSLIIIKYFVLHFCLEVFIFFNNSELLELFHFPIFFNNLRYFIVSYSPYLSNLFS